MVFHSKNSKVQFAKHRVDFSEGGLNVRIATKRIDKHPQAVPSRKCVVFKDIQLRRQRLVNSRSGRVQPRIVLRDAREDAARVPS